MFSKACKTWKYCHLVENAGFILISSSSNYCVRKLKEPWNPRMVEITKLVKHDLSRAVHIKMLMKKINMHLQVSVRYSHRLTKRDFYELAYCWRRQVYCQKYHLLGIVSWKVLPQQVNKTLIYDYLLRKKQSMPCTWMQISTPVV